MVHPKNDEPKDARKSIMGYAALGHDVFRHDHRNYINATRKFKIICKVFSETIKTFDKVWFMYTYVLKRRRERKTDL